MEVVKRGIAFTSYQDLAKLAAIQLVVEHGYPEDDFHTQFNREWLEVLLPAYAHTTVPHLYSTDLILNYYSQLLRLSEETSQWGYIFLCRKQFWFGINDFYDGFLGVYRCSVLIIGKKDFYWCFSCWRLSISEYSCTIGRV